MQNQFLYKLNIVRLYSALETQLEYLVILTVCLVSFVCSLKCGNPFTCKRFYCYLVGRSGSFFPLMFCRPHFVLSACLCSTFCKIITTVHFVNTTTFLLYMNGSLSFGIVVLSCCLSWRKQVYCGCREFFRLPLRFLICKEFRLTLTLFSSLCSSMKHQFLQSNRYSGTLRLGIAFRQHVFSSGHRIFLLC